MDGAAAGLRQTTVSHMQTVIRPISREPALDLVRRSRIFRIGIAVFTVASLLGGFATNETWLIAARVLQGIGGAIAAPTALSLIAVNFAEGSQRNRAMGVYAAMADLGSTDWPLCLSAHWCSAKATATAADSTSPGQ